MAEDSDLERTEPASPRRLEEARARGQIPRSPELATFALLIAGGTGMALLGGHLVESLERVVAAGLTLDRDAAFRPELMMARLREAGEFTILSFVPYLLLLAGVALAAPLLLSGWVFTFEAVAPQFSRISPLKGLARIFSTRGLVELGKAVGKAAIVGTVATIVLVNELEPILGLSAESSRSAVGHLGELLLLTFLTVAGAMALIVLIDVPYQLWSFGKQLRMTKEEVKREYRETEGDPQVKGRIRQLQREQARRRMMAEVPKADVIVTNPTHFAVALRYRESAMRAPMVVAKGSELVAARIVELGRASNVPILRAPPLARALHAHAELGQEIPGALYTAVAEVLAYVFQLSRFEREGGEPPVEPADIRVPPELDPALAEGEA